MPLLLYVTTGLLVAGFLFFCAGAWRVYRGAVPARPFLERAALAAIFGLLGWQAVLWLRVDHPNASGARVIAVWVQLITAAGISAVLLLLGWLAPPGRPQ